jgi:dihydrofolate synthase/folylpolyglutamate synthase
MNYQKYQIRNFSDAKIYLDGFINYEKKQDYCYNKTFKLQRLRYLLVQAAVDYKKLKAIHIAGTKGKGSTATFCASILAASGFRTGLYTSPHFFDFRERIQILDHRQQTTDHRLGIKSNLISKKDVVRLAKEIQPQLERLRFSKEFGSLSFFEVYTALAFKYFLEKNVDFVVLETGLGGRLDATNVVTPIVSIITHIGHDHTDKLGETLAQIAYEKAGIIKRNIPVICAVQKRCAYLAIKEKCQRMSSRLLLLGKDFQLEKVKLLNNYSIFDFKSGKLNLHNLKIYLMGRHQVENASLALAAMSVVGENASIGEKINFKDGLNSTFLSGRFEIIKNNPLVIVDVAHNPSSFRALAESLKHYYPFKKIILIFAASRDKDIKHMLDKITFKHLILTSFNNPRSFTALEIQKLLNLKYALLSGNIQQAFEMAKKLSAGQKNSLILISGSLFLVSEAKILLQGASLDTRC